MTIEVSTPDGSVVEFPDGTDPATMKKAMAAKFGAPKVDRAAAWGGGGTITRDASGAPRPGLGMWQDIKETANRNWQDVKQSFADPTQGMNAAQKEEYERANPMRNITTPLNIVGSLVNYAASPVEGAATNFFGRPAAPLLGGRVSPEQIGRDIALPVTMAAGGPEAGSGNTLARIAKSEAEAQGMVPYVAEVPTRAAVKEADITNAAIDKINRKAKADKVTAEDVMKAQTRALEEGDTLSLAQLNKPNLTNLAGTMYRRGGEVAKQTIAQALDDAKKGATNVLTGAIGKLKSGSSFLTIDALQKAQSAAARPLWEKAMEVPSSLATEIGKDPTIREIMKDPDFRRGMQRGIVIAKKRMLGEGKPWDDAVDRKFGVVRWEGEVPITEEIPTMQQLDAGRRGLDALINEQVHPLGHPRSGKLTDMGAANKMVRDRLVTRLDQLNPDYRPARNAWADSSSSITAIRDGAGHFSNPDSNEQILHEFSELSDGDKEFYRLGAAEAKVDALERAPRGADPAKRVANSIRDDKRWQMLFPSKKDADKFLDTVQRKRDAFDADTRIRGNSLTAERMGADADEGADNIETMLRLAGAAGKAKTGNLLGLARDVKQWANEIAETRQTPVNNAIARILATPNLGGMLNTEGSGVNLLRRVGLPETQKALARGQQQSRAAEIGQQQNLLRAAVGARMLGPPAVPPPAPTLPGQQSQ